MEDVNSSSMQIFNQAIDIFFKHNPANPYWILLAMYLRKQESLNVVPNYKGPEINIIAPKVDFGSWLGSGCLIEWDDDTEDLSIIGHICENERLSDIVDRFRSASNENFDKIKQSPTNSLHQWHSDFLLKVACCLMSIDSYWFESNFISLFDKITTRILGKEHYEFTPHPNEITQLISGIIGSAPHRIYNPFAGTGLFSSIAYNHHKSEYIGEETSIILAAIGDLRILSTGIDGAIHNTDSIHRNMYGADVLVSVPPFMLDISDITIEWDFDGRNDASTLLLRKCAQEDVVGYIVCPSSMNFKMGYHRRLREYLVQMDCIDMIIYLPAKLFDKTSIPTSLYVINRNHNHKGNIRLIDATSMFTESIRKNILDVNNVLNIVRNGGHFSVEISIEDVVRSDYNFSPELYFNLDIDIPENADFRPITELGEIVKTHASNKISNGKFANFSQLSNTNRLKIYTSGDFQDDKLPSSAIEISQDCVLISNTGGLRSVCIETDGCKLYSNPSLFCFIPNKLILPQYLILQLMQDYVQKQVGASYSHITISRPLFERIKIIVPSIDDQQKAIDEYKAKIISDLGMEISFLKLQHFNEYERNMHLRKHHLKQVMNDVIPAARRIANFVSEQEGPFTKYSIVAERSQATLKDYSIKLFQNVEKINKLITALTEETQYGQSEVLDLTMFIASYCNSKINERFEISYYGHSDFFQDDSLIEEQLRDALPSSGKVYITAPPITAYISPDSLVSVFDNIVANAVEHGFTDPERLDYAIRIEFNNFIQDEKEMVEIRVQNNGSKLPIGMTPDRIFTWGVGSNTGLGAWQAKNIVEHYGGTMKFVQYDDEADGFNIEYRFSLPMKE